MTEECQYDFEIFQSIHDDPLIECPKCKLKSLRLVIYAPIIRDKTCPKTLGALGEANFKKLSQDQKDKMFAKEIEHREKRHHQTKILKNPNQYIETGQC